MASTRITIGKFLSTLAIIFGAASSAESADPKPGPGNFYDPCAVQNTAPGGTPNYVEAAEKCWWNTFHGQKYDQIDKVNSLIEKGLKQAQGAKDVLAESLMQGRYGFLNAWQAAEIATDSNHQELTNKATQGLQNSYRLNYKIKRTAAGVATTPVSLKSDLINPSLLTGPSGAAFPAVVSGFLPAFGSGVLQPIPDHANAVTAYGFDQADWFNMASPVFPGVGGSFACIQGKLPPSNPACSKNLITMTLFTDFFELIKMCASLDSRFKAAYDKLKDRPYASAAQRHVSWNPDGPFTAKNPPRYVVEKVCLSSPTVPHNYENNFRMMGDILFAVCTSGKAAPGFCGGDEARCESSDAPDWSPSAYCTYDQKFDWRQDVLEFYNFVNQDPVSYSRWLYQSEMTKRYAAMKLGGTAGDKAMDALVFSAATTGCMICHKP